MLEKVVNLKTEREIEREKLDVGMGIAATSSEEVGNRGFQPKL